MSEPTTDDLWEYARSLGAGDQLDNIRGALVAWAAARIAELEEFQRYHSMPGVCDCPHCMKLMEATNDE